MPAVLKSRLPKIVVTLDPQVKEALAEGAETIAQAARDRVPVESGALRDAIHVEEKDEGAYVVAGDNKAFYGHMVEFGTTRSSARPFLIPAFETEGEQVLGAVEDVLESL